MQYYSGIGSRNTPTRILRQATEIADDLGKEGLCVRTGGALGMDTAFLRGAVKHPFENYEGDPKWLENRGAIEILAEVRHKLNIEDGDNIPPLAEIRPYVLSLLVRNMIIILGPTLDIPSEFVLAWTPGGKLDGGTRYGLKLADMRGIPVYNYGVLTDREIRTILRNKHGYKV